MIRFKNDFRDYRGKTLGFHDLFRVRKTRERVSGKVTVVEVSVSFMPFCAALKGRGGKFVGVTRCRDGDVFDAGVGLSIAYHKAMEKAYAFIMSSLAGNARLMRGYAESCECLAMLARRRRDVHVGAWRMKGGVS